jgi:hypothetical protein
MFFVPSPRFELRSEDYESPILPFELTGQFAPGVGIEPEIARSVGFEPTVSN